MIQQLLKSLDLQQNFDIIKREIGPNQEVTLIYVNSLVDGQSVSEIIKGINLLPEVNFLEIKKTLVNGSLSEENDFEKIQKGILSGVLCLAFSQQILLLETRSYPSRSIGEPDTEKTIRGSKDGFNENIITNVGLIRRRIRTDKLKMMIFTIGEISKTDVVLCFVDGVAPQTIVDKLIFTFKSMKIDSLVMSDRTLEENLFNQTYNYYPLVRYSERPDIVASHILKGHIAIIVDNSASVILSPTSLFDHMKHAEEYLQTPLIGSFIRLVRYFAVFGSVLLLPLWFVLVKETNYSGIFLVRPITEYTIPLAIQIIAVELMIEVVRIATIHTPTQLSSAMGLIAALLLGEIAMSLGFFIPEILLYCAIAAIGGFATPSYELSLANKLTKLILILCVAFLGKIGFLIGINALLYYLVNIKVFSFPYLYPFLPFNLKDFTNMIFRKNTAVTREKSK